MISRNFKIQPVACILILTGLFIFSSCNDKNSAGNQDYQKLVKTAPVEEISSVKIRQFPGTIEEAEQVSLAFRVAGPIQKIYVKEGDYVKNGQLVAQMDPRDYEVQKVAIEAQVKQLQSEYDRVAELNKRQSVADNDYEKMKAGKEMAEAKLKNAEDQLKDTKLYAPFSGYITNVMFDNGELVNHGTPIASLIDVSLLKVEINVPASMYLNKDKITKMECTQENIDDQSFLLTLYSNNVKANNNGLYKLYLYHKPDRDTKLAPGMNVSVNISYGSSETSLLSIPAEAVLERSNELYVWAIEKSKVTARKIETNHLVKNGRIGVLSGLSLGEEVVVGGLHLLSENETVRVVAPKSDTNVGNIL